MGRSADLSLHLIATQKRLLPKVRLDQALREAHEQGVSFESILAESGALAHDQLQRLVKTRRRHGRRCGGCEELTYLLPRQNEQNTPCEHCGSAP